MPDTDHGEVSQFDPYRNLAMGRYPLFYKARLAVAFSTYSLNIAGGNDIKGNDAFPRLLNMNYVFNLHIGEGNIVLFLIEIRIVFQIPKNGILDLVIWRISTPSTERWTK